MDRVSPSHLTNIYYVIVILLILINMILAYIVLLAQRWKEYKNILLK